MRLPELRQTIGQCEQRRLGESRLIEQRFRRCRLLEHQRTDVLTEHRQQNRCTLIDCRAEDRLSGVVLPPHARELRALTRKQERYRQLAHRRRVRLDGGITKLCDCFSRRTGHNCEPVRESLPARRQCVREVGKGCRRLPFKQIRECFPLPLQSIL